MNEEAAMLRSKKRAWLLARKYIKRSKISFFIKFFALSIIFVKLLFLKDVFYP